MIPNELKEIANRIAHFGGKAFIVGGFVRDMVLGLPSKDIDVEVFGMGKGTLKGILTEFGKVDVVGQSFGVIKLTTTDNDFDFSLPRLESKKGRGHTGFIVETDKDLTPKEAAERRDFPFNTLLMNIESGQILDFFGGVQDLTNKTIKATSKHFKDDPLRVLRGFQFASRFDLSLEDKKTIKMCKQIKSEFDELAKERLWVEFEKWASKGQKPSLGIDFLIKSGWLTQRKLGIFNRFWNWFKRIFLKKETLFLFPELANTLNVKQDACWHPEGALMEHQKQAVDLAVEFSKRENLTKEERLVLVFAALCHDFGKVTTTEKCEDNHIRSKGHDKAGVEPTRKFLESIDAPIWLIEQVCALVSEHMFNVHCRQPTARSIRRLARRVKPSNIKMLALLMEIDASARFPKPRCKPSFIDRMLELARENDCEKDEVKALLMGRHLIQLGMKPGREFGVILAEALQQQLDGTFSDLDGAIEWVKGRV